MHFSVCEMVFDWMFHPLLMLSLRGRILSSFTLNAWQMLHQKPSSRSSAHCLLFHSYFSSLSLDLMIRVQLVLSREWRTPFGEWKVASNQDRSHIVAKRLVGIIPSLKFHRISRTGITCRRWTIYLLQWCTETLLKAEGYLFCLLRHTGETNFQSWACIPHCCSKEPSPRVLTGGDLGCIRWHFL